MSSSEAGKQGTTPARDCGDGEVSLGREGVPGPYAFFARYVLNGRESCLDVGGGLGRGLEILRAKTHAVRAIDVDPRLSAFGVEMGDVGMETTGSVDWVLAVDVVEHVQNDTKFLSDLWRVSRKGVLVSTPNRDHHPDRQWPYHVREYGTAEFARLVGETIRCDRVWHWGGSTYGGDLRMTHLTPAWEHQVVLCVRGRMVRLAALFAMREMMLRLLRR